MWNTQWWYEHEQESEILLALIFGCGWMSSFWHHIYLECFFIFWGSFDSVLNSDDARQIVCLLFYCLIWITVLLISQKTLLCFFVSYYYIHSATGNWYYYFPTCNRTLKIKQQIINLRWTKCYHVADFERKNKRQSASEFTSKNVINCWKHLERAFHF